jgi:phosphatidylethanolamine-binding protein (PEBP) family uncharacterized protein
MAQRTGADRRLASRASAASARVALALAALFLIALAGCGGDEDSDSGSPSAERQAGSGAAVQEGAAGDSEAPPGSAGAQDAGAAGGGGGAGEGGKQGPRVPAPQGTREPELTPEQKAEATVASIKLQSPAVRQSEGSLAALPSTYTCDGENSWPPLRWEGVPQGTVELALVAMSLQPVDGKIFFDWALAGIEPEVEEIEAGRLPRGAVMGQNGFGKVGYSICPAPGERESYFFALYALPRELALSRGFDPAELRRQAQEISQNAGLLVASYARGG